MSLILLEILTQCFAGLLEFVLMYTGQSFGSLNCCYEIVGRSNMTSKKFTAVVIFNPNFCLKRCISSYQVFIRFWTAHTMNAG